MTHKSLKVGAGGIFVIPFMKMEETLNIKIGIELGVCRRQSKVPNQPFSPWENNVAIWQMVGGCVGFLLFTLPGS